MSYILYSSIARAGGLDLLLGLESHTHEPGHRLARRPQRRRRLARLRRRSGRALIGLGSQLVAWGRRWAPAAASGPADRSLKLATK